MDAKFAHVGSLDDKACEECAELIQAVMKAKRFGLDNWNPHTNRINRNAILEECDDVLHSVSALKKGLE